MIKALLALDFGVPEYELSDVSLTIPTAPELIFRSLYRVAQTTALSAQSLVRAGIFAVYHSICFLLSSVRFSMIHRRTKSS